MSKRKKRLERLRRNPNNVSLDELRIVLEDYGFEFRKTVGSHYTFSVIIGGVVQLFVVPFRRPIKPIYVKRRLQLIDKIAAEWDEDESDDDTDQ